MTQKKIGIADTGTTIAYRRLRIYPGIGDRCAIDISPGCCVVAKKEQLAAEVEDVLAADHRNHIGGVESHLLINCVGCGLKLIRTALIAAVCPVDGHGGKDIGLGELQT